MELKKKLGIMIIICVFLIVVVLLIGSQSSSIPTITTKQSEQLSSNHIDNPSNVAGQLSYSIFLDRSLPSTIDKILIYKVVPPHYIRSDIISLGQKFNMSVTDRIKEGQEGFGIMKEEHSMHAYLMNSGWIEFTNSNRAHTVNTFDLPGNLPSDNEAVKIATTFLKERNLLPEGAVVKRTDHGRIYQLVKNGDDIVTWEDINVWFGRKLNGYPVEGTQLMVAVGGRGDVIEYFTNWRNYEPYGELSLKTPEQAFADLQRKGVPVSTVPVGMSTSDKVTINDIYLAYHTKAGAETEYYLEPVWVFKGNVIENGKSIKPVEEYIPALKEVPVELTGRKQIVTPLPTTEISANITVTQTTAVITANETATPAVITSPTSNTTSAAEGTQTITFPVTTVPTITGTTAAINATNSL